MQVAEQDLPGAQSFDFDGLRLLHLHHQVGGIHVGGVSDDFRTNRAIGRIVETDGAASIVFDQQAVPGSDQLGAVFRRQCDPVFVVFDFLRQSDQHGFLSAICARHNYARRPRARASRA